jgi:FkbM family methyltransferase
MSLYRQTRKRIKQWIYGSCPGFDRAFPYYGTKVYFPQNSHLFKRACEEGIYEIENTQLLSSLVRPNTVYFDVGANIGLMSVPVLHECDSCTVVSFEPSPNTLELLKRTAEESPYSDRWRVVGKAVGNEVGSLDFFIASAELGAFDGFQDTERAGTTRKITVPVTTLDMEWEAMDRPSVSLIKIDVEGAELTTLQGAVTCIKSKQPDILLEWTSVNLKAYNCQPEDLLTFASSIGYQVYGLHQLLPIVNSTILILQMRKSETFLLTPN